MMQLDNLAADGQTDTHAIIITAALQPREKVDYPAHIPSVESGGPVRDGARGKYGADRAKGLSAPPHAG